MTTQAKVRGFDHDNVRRFKPPDLLIERFGRSHSITEDQAREQFEEIKKFVALCALNPSKSYAPSLELDEMWHEFVLFSPDYFRFCDMLGRYVHHCPTRERMHESYENTLADMPALFGAVSEKWWRPLSAADCSSLCTGDNYCDSQGG